MSLLPGSLPYIASIIAYWTVYRGLFREEVEKPPSGWQWRLVSPLFVPPLTPLVLASSPAGSEHILLLISGAGVGVVISFCAMGILIAVEGNENEGSEVSPRGKF